MNERFADNAERIKKIESRYDSQAKQIFSKPANFCQFCGQEMRDTGDMMKDRWQKRWSIHFDCANAVDNQLDRSVGILSERKSKR